MKDKIDYWDEYNGPKEDFLHLVEGVIQSSLPQMRWCMKNQVVTHIRNLTGGSFKCWECEFHVIHGTESLCDPI